MAKNTINKDTYIGGGIVRNFLELISEHLSRSDDNSVYIKVDEVCNALGIKNSGDWEGENWNLSRLLQIINLKNLGVTALGGISYYPAFPDKEQSHSIEEIAKDLPNLDGISFEVGMEKFLETTKERGVKKYKPKKVSLFRGDIKVEITIGKLSAYNDGGIRYDDREVELRNQLKDLCRLFMEKPNQLITLDDIKDHLIHADRRPIISFDTISKYVSELHNLLRSYYDKDVIFNQKEEGWFFKP